MRTVAYVAGVILTCGGGALAISAAIGRDWTTGKVACVAMVVGGALVILAVVT